MPSGHRGAHPDDARLFGSEALAELREASFDVAWLLGRGYPLAASVTLVGNRFNLDARQRLALQRSCCSEQQRQERARRMLAPEAIRGRTLRIDGFNLLVSLEVALGGGVVLRGADGCIRDLAGLRGSYHLVEETEPALRLAHEVLAELAPARAEWLLDAPVSNSGRVKALILEVAAGWPFETTAELVPDPDPILAKTTDIASSDSMILERCGEWANLSAWVIARKVPSAWVVSLG